MTRHHSIDFFKGIACLGVIMIHARTFGASHQLWFDALEVYVNQLCRFAVPFFFMISGFWLERAFRGETPARHGLKTAYKLIKLFIIWSFLYGIIITDFKLIHEHSYLRCVYWKLEPLWSAPFDFIWQGSETHLWFLPALAIATVLSVLFKDLKLSSLVVLSSLVYLLGVLAGPYQPSALGFSLDFDTRNGPFFSWLCVVMGQVCYHHRENIRTLPPSTLYLSALIGCLAHLIEVLVVIPRLAPGIDLTQVDYGFTTVFYGGAIALLALHHSMKSSPLSHIGQYSLGVYLMHLWFVKIFLSLPHLHHFEILSVIFPILIAVGTYQLSLKLWGSRFKFLVT